MVVKKLTKKERELEEEKKIRVKKQKSRDLSLKEGIFASAKDAFGMQYLSPFAIAINSSNSIVAMMSSVTGLLGPLTQIFGSKSIEKNSRKKIVRKFTFLESISWLLFLVVGFLFYKGLLLEVLPLMFLLFFSVYTIFLNAMIPAWFSWTGDIVSSNHRGRWLSKRNFLIGFTSLVVAISSAYFLEYMKGIDKSMLGFGILFSLAFIMRLTCWSIFKKQYEPKMEIHKGTYFSFLDFLLKARKSNFGRFSIFKFFFYFSVTIANSLLAVYLLRSLNLSYVNFIIVILSGTFFALLVTEMWGKFADRYGNYKVLAITTILIPLIPLFWILHTSVVYLILVPGFLRGVGWAGFNLSAGNFIYDNVSQEKRGLAFSYSNMMTGLGIFFGGLVGAAIIKFLHTSATDPIIFIFIFSSLVSMVVVAGLIPLIKEVKNKKHEKSSRELRRFLVKQIRPTLSEEMHQIVGIRKYVWKK